MHSALEAAGAQAARLLPLWSFMLWASCIVFVLVMAAFLWALFHRRPVSPPDDRKLARIIAGAGAATVLTLFIYLAVDLRVGRATTTVPRPALVIKLTGHQWWWDVEYQDSVLQHRVHTANEFHIPVGEPVLIQLEAADVIHSFWVPSLAGKKDLIPGHPNTMWLVADRAGTYRAQCAEFCGHQHAKMAMLVIAEPRDRFNQWYERQLAPAAEPRDSAGEAGRQVFMGSSCPMCHTIQGTLAASRVGPPLTHLASRHTIAAGTLPNTRGNLGAWILDPQAVKPGASMPPSALSGRALTALLAYLESLE
jgi:cytochrome c oxidase subunit 2